jgi:hypothetical protein
MNNIKNIISARSLRSRLLLAAAIAGLLWLAPSAPAADDTGYKKLVATWEMQRDSLVRSIVRRWLRGATPEALQADLLTVINLDIRLAVDPSIPLYITAFKDSQDPAASLRDVVETYLRRLKIDCESQEFFRGRSFTILRTENLSSQKPLPLAFMKWAEKEQKTAVTAEPAHEK